MAVRGGCLGILPTTQDLLPAGRLDPAGLLIRQAPLKCLPPDIFVPTRRSTLDKGFPVAPKKTSQAGRPTNVPLSLVAEMPRGGHCCTTLEFSPDSAYLAAGAGDRKIHIYDVASGKRLHHLREHSGGVDAVSFSPDSNLLASSGVRKENRRAAGGEMLIWQVASGKLLRRVPLAPAQGEVSIKPVLFSPDGNQVACVVVDYDDGESHVAIVDPTTGKVTLELPVDPYGCKLAFAPDGKLLAGAFKDRLVVWQLPTGKVSKTIPRAGKTKAITYSPDGKTLAVVGADGAVTLLAASTGKAGKSLKESPQHSVAKVQFSADGKRVATIGETMHGTSIGEVRVWDLKSGDLVLSVAGRTGVESPQGFPGECALSGDLSLFANAGGKARLWRVEGS
jgi:WD40 repeat protein